MNKFIIAGTHSGCGKTTVVCGILHALAKQRDVTAFKCGPDYIDPMFHRLVQGVRCHNLDGFMLSPDMINCMISREKGTVVIEGVMGFYDGNDGSAHHISMITETPAVIVIDCNGMSDSIGAVMNGFLHYRPNRIAGFIFNRLPPKLIPLAQRLCRENDTTYFGCLPPGLPSVESRRLGLVTPDSINDIRDKLQVIGEAASENILLDKLLALDSVLSAFTPPEIKKIGSPVISVSRDEAFCFIYEECMELLEKMGCTIRYFSPLRDSRLPECDGLILTGGYPELYAKQLSENHSMLDSIRSRISDGLPYIAECGGFMYLHDEMDADGLFKMAGVIHGRVRSADRLVRFGYITMTAQTDNLLCKNGESIKAHEFHYYDSTDNGNGFHAVKPDGREWDCCHVSDRHYAGFPHLNFLSDITTAERFIIKCMEYGVSHGQDKADHRNG